jgi:hypothetical protein
MCEGEEEEHRRAMNNALMKQKEKIAFYDSCRPLRSRRLAMPKDFEGEKI